MIWIVRPIFLNEVAGVFPYVLLPDEIGVASEGLSLDGVCSVLGGVPSFFLGGTGGFFLEDRPNEVCSRTEDASLRLLGEVGGVLLGDPSNEVSCVVRSWLSLGDTETSSL